MSARSRCSTLFGIAILTLALITGCGSAESKKAKYLDKGKTYLTEENYDKASVELKNVLQIDPKHAEAHYLLGQVAEKKNNFPQAFGLYNKAVELAPDMIEARRRLGRIYLLAGQPDKAKEQAEAILKTRPGDLGGRLISAAILSRDGNDEAAIKELTAIFDADKSNEEAVALLAAIYEKRKEIDKSRTVLEAGVATNPKNIALRIQLARLSAAQGRNDDVEKLLSGNVQIEPDKITHRIALALFFVQINRLDDAEKTLRDAIADDPEDTSRHIALAEFLSQRRNVKAAEDELKSSIAALPKASDLRFGLAKLYEAIQQPEKAEPVYQSIIDRAGDSPDGLKAKGKLAELLLRRNEIDEGSSLVEEVLKESARDNQALMLKSRLSLQRGETQDAITALRTVLKDQPNSVDALTLLADAHLRNKEIELAEESLKKAVENNPKHLPARLTLARFLLGKKDVDSASKEVERMLNQSPKDVGGLLLKADIAMARNSPTQAQQVLESLRNAHPDSPVGPQALGRLFQSQKKYDAAAREFESAAARSAAPLPVLQSLAQARVAQGRPELALAKFDEIAKQNPKHTTIHAIRAEILQGQKKLPEAEAAWREAITANPKWNVPYLGLSRLQAARGNATAANSVLEEGLKLLPEDGAILLEQAQSAERGQQFDRAITTYDQVLRKNPDQGVAINNLASLLSDRRTDKASYVRALQLALKLEKSQHPAHQDTIGWAYYRNGDYTKAISAIKSALEKAPQIAIFHYHLGMAYFKSGDKAGAKAELTKALDTKVDYTGIEEARATLKSL